MNEPTEDRWADARRVLARRTPESIVTIDQGGIDVRTGRELRSVLRLTVARRPEGIQGDWDLDALSLAWNVLPDLLDERDRYRAALERLAGWGGAPAYIAREALAPDGGDGDATD